MRQVISVFAVVLSFLFFCTYAIAGCEYVEGYTPQTSSINFGDVTIQRDAAIGTVFKKIIFTNLANYPGNIIKCDAAPRTMKYGDSAFQTVVRAGITYFESGVAGVGIKVTSNSSYWQGIWNSGALPILLVGGQCVWSPSGWIEYCGGSWGQGGLNFELVKIAAQTGTGQINANGYILKASIQDEIDAYNIGVISSKVTTLKCNLTTPSLTFAMGDISASKFTAAIGNIPDGEDKTQNLGLDCDADANINVSLAGTQNPDVSETSVLALTGQGDAGVAQGVGVQLLYNGTPLELNKNIVLKKSYGGQETFPIVARYYQTKSTVMPGKANAVATLNISYQ